MDDCKSWITRIKDSESFFENAFSVMRSCEQVVETGFGPKHDTAVYQKLRQKFGSYHLPYLMAYLEILSASLYAKNPEITFKLVEREDYQVWDKSPDSLLKAAQTLQAHTEQTQQAEAEFAMAQQQGYMGPPPSFPPPPEQEFAIVKEVNDVHAVNLLVEGQGRTLAKLVNSYMNSPIYSFKESFNDFLKLVGTHGIAFVGARVIDDEQAYGTLLDLPTSKQDVRRKIEALQKVLEKDSSDQKKVEKLQKRMALLEAEFQANPVQSNSGLFFHFCKAYDFIVDQNCKDLQSFRGAAWYAIKHTVSRDKFLATYPHIDKDEVSASKDMMASKASSKKSSSSVTVYEIFNKEDNSYSVVSPDYSKKGNSEAAFVVEPEPIRYYLPDFTCYTPVTWRTPLQEGQLYPVSDIEAASNSQLEANIVKVTYLASLLLGVPRFLAKKGTLSNSDKLQLNNFDPFAVTELSSDAMEAVKLDELFKPLDFGSKRDSDYNPEVARGQMNLILGVGDVAYGASSGGTATEASLASQGSQGLFSYKRDKLDACLSNLVRKAGTLLLQSTKPEIVARRVGIGAKWIQHGPAFDQADFTEDLFLCAEAGTAGKTNSLSMIDKIDRSVNTLLQLPGVQPDALTEAYANYLEIPVEKLLQSGLPSISALNSMVTNAQKSATPNELAQGGQGQFGQSSPSVVSGTAQKASMPTPQEGIEYARF